MRSNGNLQKLYDRLTPRERLALIITAHQRNDEPEIQLLLDSAPRLSFRVVHHFGLLEALTQTAMFYVMSQLERAWMILLLADLGEVDLTNNEIWDALRICSYVYCSFADAWNSFCGELGVDAQHVLSGLPGTDMALEFAEEITRTMAYSPAEAMTAFKGHEEEGQLVTVESATAQLRGQYESWLQRWE